MTVDQPPSRGYEPAETVLASSHPQMGLRGNRMCLPGCAQEPRPVRSYENAILLAHIQAEAAGPRVRELMGDSILFVGG
jgi:hypothetical protein